jgi:hypothetical protein
MADENRGRQRGPGRWWLAALALPLAVLGASLPLALPWRCPVTQAASEQVKPGMTLAQVEKILGGPPGDYRTRPPAPVKISPEPVKISYERLSYGRRMRILERPIRREGWEGDDGTIEVGFYEDDGTVKYVSFEEAEPSSPGIIEVARWRVGKIRDRLGR